MTSRILLVTISLLYICSRCDGVNLYGISIPGNTTGVGFKTYFGLLSTETGVISNLQFIGNLFIDGYTVYDKINQLYVWNDDFSPPTVGFLSIKNGAPGGLKSINVTISGFPNILAHGPLQSDSSSPQWLVLLFDWRNDGSQAVAVSVDLATYAYTTLYHINAPGNMTFNYYTPMVVDQVNNLLYIQTLTGLYQSPLQVFDLTTGDPIKTYYFQQERFNFFTTMALNDEIMYFGTVNGPIFKMNLKTEVQTYLAGGWCPPEYGIGNMDDLTFNFDAGVAYTIYSCYGSNSIYIVDLSTGSVSTTTGGLDLLPFQGIQYPH